MHADTTMRPPGSPLQANRVRQSKPDIHKLSLHDAAGGPWPVSEFGLGPPPALAAFAFTLRDDVAASAVSQLVMRQAVHPDDAPDARPGSASTARPNPRSPQPWPTLANCRGADGADEMRIENPGHPCTPLADLHRQPQRNWFDQSQLHMTMLMTTARTGNSQVRSRPAPFRVVGAAHPDFAQRCGVTCISLHRPANRSLTLPDGAYHSGGDPSESADAGDESSVTKPQTPQNRISIQIAKDHRRKADFEIAPQPLPRSWHYWQQAHTNQSGTYPSTICDICTVSEIAVNHKHAASRAVLRQTGQATPSS